MSKWLYELDIKQHITEDRTWAGMAKAANGVAKQLYKNLPAVFFFNNADLYDNVNFLDCVEESDWDIYESEQELLDEINYALGCIYTFADENRIWLG